MIDGYQSLKTARELDRASRDGSSIVLMINSPGGYVFAGRLILDAMKMARKRGSRIRCLVPFLAASMAFQIYAMCDERYAMEHALLLWHPPRISGQSMTADRLEYAIARLRAIELEFIPALLEKLNIPEDIFFYHYDRETLWSATELKRVLPDFLELVDDVEGMPDKVDLYR